MEANVTYKKSGITFILIQNFEKAPLEEKLLIVQGHFCIITGIIRRKTFFKNRLNGKCKTTTFGNIDAIALKSYRLSQCCGGGDGQGHPHSNRLFAYMG